MKLFFLLLVLVSSLATVAQQPAAPPAPQLAPVPNPDALGILNELEQTAQSASLNLARLRIDKWKGEREFKEQAERNSESLQRNMTAALPEVLQQLRKNPNDLGGTFKLYHNVNVIYDYFEAVTEAAGAFGKKEEFQALATDAQRFEDIRRSLADRITFLIARNDQELAQARARLAQMAAAAAAAPPKRIVVDDTEPPKRTPRKKKPSAATATPKQ